MAGSSATHDSDVRLIKALHVIPSLSTKHGGPSAAMPTLARALTQAGVAVTIASTDDDGSGCRAQVPLETEVQNSNDVRTIYFRKNTDFYKVSLGLTRWLWDHVANFDVVHIHALFSYASTAAAFIAQRKRVPYIVRPLGVLNRWGMQNRRPFVKAVSFQLFESRILRNAAAIHYTSAGEQREASIGRTVTNKEHIIPLPIETPPIVGPNVFLDRFPAAKNKRIVLFLSRIDPKKGIELLLDAFGKIRPSFPDSVLVIAGDGDAGYVSRLKKHAGESSPLSIIWTGHLAGDEKWSAFAAAKIFVLPSFSENFGIAAAESLACGVPTIVTTGVGLADKIKSADAGLVVEPNAAAIANALEQLLSDDSRQREFAERGRDLVTQEFSLGSVGQKLRQLYEQALTQTH
jgi:glycosyltransferase involved in cell wall biosynthesis